MTKTAIIVQVRMTSARLPGKTMEPIEGRPLLDHLLDRLDLCARADAVIVATTANAADDPIVALCEGRDAAVYRGSEDDVLGRYEEAAAAISADVIVRVTGDCPLIDPAIVDGFIAAFHEQPDPVDYLWAGGAPRLPNGMPAEVFGRAALERAAEEASEPYDREHVTPFFRRPEAGFRIAELNIEKDLSRFRLSVDTAADLELVRKVIASLAPHGAAYSVDDIVALLERNPDWMALNADVEQTTGPYARKN